jgi:uncharacterized protein (DUF3820 family)
MTTAPDYFMGFGKYKGEHISNVPSGYLRWIQSNFDEDERNELLLAAVEDELDVRDGSDAHFEEE